MKARLRVPIAARALTRSEASASQSSHLSLEHHKNVQRDCFATCVVTRLDIRDLMVSAKDRNNALEAAVQATAKFILSIHLNCTFCAGLDDVQKP